VLERNKIKIQNPNIIKLYIHSVNCMSYFVMIHLKTTSSCSRLHVGLVILCCYETSWRWQLGAETCSSYHFTWGVFRDSCFILFFLVYFVGWYIECKEIHGMNKVILVSNNPCDPLPLNPQPGFVGCQADNLCSISHMYNPALHRGIALPVLVAIYMHSNTQQTVTGNCVTDTEWLCTRGCLMTGAVHSAVLRHVITSYR
jgi:hypothetical protein